jgi:hypothetical protein
MDSKVSLWLRRQKEKMSKGPHGLTRAEIQQQIALAFAPLHCVFQDFSRGSVVNIEVFAADGERVFEMTRLRPDQFHSPRDLADLLLEARQAIAAQGQILDAWTLPIDGRNED